MASYSPDWPARCPPSNAEDASGMMYRVCKEPPPSQRDFQGHQELGKRSSSDPCMRYGLSVFRDLAEARHLKVLFPQLGSMVFRGELTPEQANTHQPNRGHRIPPGDQVRGREEKITTLEGCGRNGQG